MLTVAGCPTPVNLIKCSSYSPQVLLDGADINAINAVVKVSKNDDGNILQEWKVDSAFWHFLFDGKHKLLSFGTKKPAQTCIRMAYKEMDMELEFDFKNLDPTVGTIASSHYEKWLKIEEWESNPFMMLMRDCKHL